MTTAHGIHHITALGTDPQRLLEFYTEVLGLRLVKKSVNQDDPSAYHLFFGDRTGEPGMDLTFFTFPFILSGARGTGLVTMISLAVPQDSLTFWQERFERHEVRHEGIREHLDLERLVFYDFDNQRLELVGIPNELLAEDNSLLWTTNQISADEAIRHFHSARLTVADKASVEPVLLDVLGYSEVKSLDATTLYHREGQTRAAFLEISEQPEQEPGRNAAGTVHHIAFSVEDEQSQLELRARVEDLGLRPTEVIDRYYFKSVYFRTEAGVLFELATMEPGFTVDEAEAELGQKLALPPFLEDYRKDIEAGLKPIAVKQAT